MCNDIAFIEVSPDRVFFCLWTRCLNIRRNLHVVSLSHFSVRSQNVTPQQAVNGVVSYTRDYLVFCDCRLNTDVLLPLGNYSNGNWLLNSLFKTEVVCGFLFVLLVCLLGCF